MAKIVGKDLEFWWDGKEYPVISVDLTEAFDTLDTTDTSTSGDGKDFEVGRAERSFTVEANMYAVDGAEVITGTLILGQKYRLTGGTMVETSQTISVVGQLFVSDGTGVATGTNKVVPLGITLTGKTLTFTHNAVSMPVMSCDISTKYDLLDVTDSTTSGDATESVVSRGERESKVVGIADSATADKLTTNPTAQTGVILFASGQTITGTVVPTNKVVSDKALDKAQIDYTFKWKGAPTELACGFPPADTRAFKIILKRGATTHKEYTGTAVINEKSIASEVKGNPKITYSMHVNGAITYAVAN